MVENLGFAVKTMRGGPVTWQRTRQWGRSKMGGQPCSFQHQRYICVLFFCGTRSFQPQYLFCFNQKSVKDAQVVFNKRPRPFAGRAPGIVESGPDSRRAAKKQRSFNGSLTGFNGEPVIYFCESYNSKEKKRGGNGGGTRATRV